MANDIIFKSLQRLGTSYIVTFTALQEYDSVKVYLNSTVINTYAPQNAGDFSINVDKATLLLYADEIKCEGVVGTSTFIFIFKMCDYLQTVLSIGGCIPNGKTPDYYPITYGQAECYSYRSPVNIPAKSIVPELIPDPSVAPVKDLLPFLAPYPAYDYERGWNDGFILGRYAK